ncbi:helix-turn-helix domain-containing protein [Xanthobacter dioxanivorans]
MRELRNVIEGMLLIAEGEELSEADIPDEIWTQPESDTAPSTAPAGEAGHLRGLSGMENAERLALLRAMQMHKGNMTAVARDLGIAKSTVYAKLRRFGLEGVMGETRRFQL